MRALFTLVVLLLLSLQPIISFAGGRCTGSAYCSACTNCSSCKYCAEEGGSCGVCGSTETYESVPEPTYVPTEYSDQEPETDNTSETEDDTYYSEDYQDDTPEPSKGMPTGVWVIFGVIGFVVLVKIFGK